MTRVESIKKGRVSLWALLLVAFIAIAGTVVINASDPAYSNLSNVADTNVGTDWEIRNAGLTQIAATYRGINGLGTLDNNEEFKVIWKDGSSEKAKVVNKFSTLGTVPVPGSQESGNGTSIGGGGGWADDGFGDDWDGTGPQPGKDGVNCAVAFVVGC
jgi:hypothetical protein